MTSIFQPMYVWLSTRATATWIISSTATTPPPGAFVAAVSTFADKRLNQRCAKQTYKINHPSDKYLPIIDGERRQLRMDASVA